MTSAGKNFNNEIFNFALNNTDNDYAAHEMKYELQRRLSNYHQNNPGVVLNKSQMWAGISNNGQKEALGGPLIQNQNNTNNIKGGLCSDEFPFWSLNQSGKIVNAPEEQNNLTENFTDEKNNNNDKDDNSDSDSDIVLNDTKENFIQENYDDDSNDNSTMTYIYIVLGIILLLLIGFVIYNSYTSRPVL